MIKTRIKYVQSRPKGFAAYTWTFGPFAWVHITESEKNNVGLRVHELTHVAQAQKNWLHPLFYKYSAKYRMNAECEAYAAQYLADGDYGPAVFKKYVNLIYRSYDLQLKYTQQDIIECLNKHLGGTSYTLHGEV